MWSRAKEEESVDERKIAVDSFLSDLKEKRSAVCPLIGTVLVVRVSESDVRTHRLCCILSVILPVRGGNHGSRVMVRVFDGTQVREGSWILIPDWIRNRER